MLRNPISRALSLAGACFVAIAPFFWGGSTSGHDFEFHMFSWMEVLGQWRHGILYPRWAAMAHWGYGEARFLFYPPASWTLGAALGAVLPWKIVPGAYCWIVLMLAGAAMYRLAREWLTPEDALFAAVLYALNPYHLLIIYWRSAYAELLAGTLLPILLLCLLRIFSPASESDLRPTLCLSLTLAAAWLTNVPGAVMIHYSTVGLALVFTVTGATTGRRFGVVQGRGPLVRTVLAILLGIGLASFYLLPAIYEQHWINVEQVLAPGVRPQDNFLFTTIADPDHNRFNLVVSTLAVVEIGVLILAIWGSRRWRPKLVETASPSARRGPPQVVSAIAADRVPWILLAAWGCGSALLMLSVTNVLWQHMPQLRYVQLPFRWLLCLNAPLAVLLAMAAQRPTARLFVSAAILGTWISRSLFFGALLGAMIFAGYRIQPPWWDSAADIREMSDAVADGPGYEGTDEYVPAGVDASELNKDPPLVSNDSGAPVSSQILTWEQTEKHFTVHAAAAENLTMRLFNYPAWRVFVNGQPIVTETTEITGLIVIPIAAGDSDVHIYFRRTFDRLIGTIFSLISLAILVAAWLRTRRNPRAASLAKAGA